ncbi:histidine--tRNA ligase [Desulfothermus naphthae]
MIKKIKGFTDLYPPEIEKYSFMEKVAREIFPLYGFVEMRTPILEKTELFARSIGDETDVVQKEMFSFLDKKGRSLSLRPEATAGVARAYIENKIYAKENISKFFTIGPMFRYERPQKGRQRQFHQVNVEVFGSSSPYIDGELIVMLMDFLKKLDIKGISLEINSLGCLRCRASYLANLKEFLEKIDEDVLCEDCKRRRMKNPLRVLDCKIESCKKIYKDAPKIIDYLCSDCDIHFKQVLNLLKFENIQFKINKNLVRGLDYYQRTTFEVMAEGIGAQSAIAGGGRYDGLIKQLGGPDLPGIGFACGMERIAQLIEIQEQKSNAFYIAIIDKKGLDLGFEVASMLRNREIECVCSYEVKSVKAHLRTANKGGARYCIIIGEEELLKRKVTLKDLITGEQKGLSLDSLEKISFEH